jgi:hypothetical protein
MPKLGRRRIIKVSLESEKGTAVAGATDVLCYDPEINPSDNFIQREPSGAYGGQAKGVLGPRIGTCKINAELRISTGQVVITAPKLQLTAPQEGMRGSKAIYQINAQCNADTGDDELTITGALDPGLAILFQGCGMATPGALTPVTAISSQKCVTAEGYFDGRKKRLYGAMGNSELSGEFGKQAFVNFDYTGLFSDLADVALPSTSHTAYPPLMVKSAVLTIGGHALSCSKFSINFNNPIEPRESQDAPEGISYYYVGAGRRYMISIDPEVEEAATWDAMALWAAGTEAAFSLTLG